MSHCSSQRLGNLFDSKLPDSGPYTASIERTCRDKDGTSFSKQYSSYMSSVKPENPRAVTESLESKTPSNQGIFGNMANVLKNVFGQPQYRKEPLKGKTETQRLPDHEVANVNEPQEGHLFPHGNNFEYTIDNEEWPTPRIQEMEGGKPKRKERSKQSRTKKSKSTKRKRSIAPSNKGTNDHKKKSRKKSQKKNVAR